MYIYIKKEIYQKEPACVLLEAGKFKIFSVAQKAPDPGEPMAQMESEDILLENSLLLEEDGLSVLFRPSIN